MDTDDDMVGSLSKKRVPYKSYDPSLMEKAMAAVQHDGKTMYRAAKDFGVPMNTLRDRLISKGIFKPKHSNVYTEVWGVTGRRRKKLPRDQWKQHITVDDDILERWHNIGRLEGLSSSAAIIRFLVSLYYGAGKQDEPKSDIRCQQCQNLLTLFCVNCQLFLQPTSSSQAVPLKQATDLDNLTITKIENENAPFSRKSVKGDLKNYFTPPERRSLRHKRSSRKTKNSSVFDVSSEEQSRSDEDQLPVDDWPDIEDISTGRDSNGNKADPSSCLDDILDSLQEQSQKKSRTKPHECPQCSETFLELSKLKWHFEETKHISEYICKKCNKSFKNKSALQQHSRVHNRQEHQCIKCGLSFKFPSRLSKHLKTHGSEKPHVCDMCGKSFVSVYYLRDHIKIHSEERRYKCDLCGAAFKQKPALYAHGKKHTNERPFQCQYCGLKFRDSQKVKIHVRTHTGEKPYKCDMCDASFVSNSNMWQHCAYVHGKSTKTHQCPECPLTFAAKGKLKVHMKNSHGSTDDTTSCQYEMIKQTLQPMYIEISETNHLVQI